jgi:hypothetical protein
MKVAAKLFVLVFCDLELALKITACSAERK